MIIRNEIPGTIVHLVGKQPRNSFNLQQLEGLAISRNCCFLQVASDRTKVGFQMLTPWRATDTTQPLLADGVILTQPNTTAVFQTADCPAVVFSNTRTGTILTLHAGRPAMTPSAGKNIINDALSTVIERSTDTAHIHVYITGSICGKHFKHDKVPHLVKPFLEIFGPGVFYDAHSHSLDLLAVLKLQLEKAGIPSEHITHDNQCTFETTDLTSHRRDGATRTTTNLVIVTKN